MRPSKLRLPDNTDATTRFLSLTIEDTGSGSGPLLPMQVVHPYPTRLNPSSASGSISPAARKYSVTTSDPGARLVLTHGFDFSPRRAAFRARRPAPIITLGFDVFVQLVIASTTTAPCSSPSIPGGADVSVATATAAAAP